MVRYRIGMVDESVRDELLDVVDGLLADIPSEPDDVTDDVYENMLNGADRLESLMESMS